MEMLAFFGGVMAVFMMLRDEGYPWVMFHDAVETPRPELEISQWEHVSTMAFSSVAFLKIRKLLVNSTI